MKLVGIKSLIFMLLILSSCLFGQTPYDVVKRDYQPKKQLVHDFGQIFSPDQFNQLEKTLVAYNDSTSTQIVIVTFKKLDGYPIELLGNEIGEYWGVGQKDKHNGIVIVFSEGDRKVTIRGGYGIQAKMPPTIEKLIIDREMIPAFREGNYYQGFVNAIGAIQLQLAGKYQAEPKAQQSEDFSGIITIFIIIFILIFLISAFTKGGGNSGGGGMRRRSPFDVIITNTGSSSWGGSSWGGGSGGGFGGFGGGSFGGGGASGSW